MQLRQQFWQLLGNWTGTEEQATEPGQLGVGARAALTFKLAAADTAVVQDYRRVGSDGTEYTAHGVFQLVADRVAWWLFDSTGRTPHPSYGDWQGDELRLLDVAPRAAVEHRFTLVGQDRLRYRIVVAGFEVGEPQLLLTGKYQRVSGH